MPDYPSRLLPKSEFQIVPQNVLAAQSGLWLIRHIESDKAIFIGLTKTLNPECIEIESTHLRDLSNNLLGIFQVDDIFFGIVKEARDFFCGLWNGAEKCCSPLSHQYLYDDKRGFYFISIDKLLRTTILHREISSDTEEEFHFKVLHTPTRSNFWHVSIRVYDKNEREVSELDVSKGKKKRIWKGVKDRLVLELVQTETPNQIVRLSPEYYTK